MFKKVVIVLLALIVASFVGCQWDYYLSKHLFKKYCNDGRVGQFIYETVELPEEYFELIPVDATLQQRDPRFEYGSYRIIKKYFERYYIYKEYEWVKISNVGPVNMIQSTVVRKLDEKLIGKAVGVSNALGWFKRFSSLGAVSGERCPSGRDGNNFPEFRRDHYNLIKNIFQKGIKK